MPFCTSTDFADPKAFVPHHFNLLRKYDPGGNEEQG
jgi:hypothetical protein